MNDLISVIVPVYNTGQYLERCVNSILQQDYKPIEIIIVDDGSTDGETSKICDCLGVSNESISVFHKENGGSASARNYGIKKARGDYIGFVDSDDVIEPKMYSSLYRDIIEHDVKVAIVNISTEEKGRIIDKKETLPAGEYHNEKLLHFFFLGNWHSACSNLYERSLFEDALFPDGEVNEDYLLNYLIFKELDKIYYDDRTFYHYVRRPGSNTSSPVSIHFLDWIKHTERVWNDFRVHNSLSNEAEYQYLFSNIVLGNKCLISMARKKTEDATKLYGIVTNNLNQNRKRVLNNPFIPKRYRRFGVLLSFTPKLYKWMVVLVLRLKKAL